MAAPAAQRRKQDERPSPCAGWPRARIQRYRIQLAYMIRSFVWATGAIRDACSAFGVATSNNACSAALREASGARTPPHQRAEAGGAPPAPWEPVGLENPQPAGLF